MKKLSVPTRIGEAILHFHTSRVWIGDFVVMPNHVHLIVQPFPGVTLEEWLYSIKWFSSTRLQKNAQLAALTSPRRGHLWQTESFDRVIRDSTELVRTRRPPGLFPAATPCTRRIGSTNSPCHQHSHNIATT